MIVLNTIVCDKLLMQCEDHFVCILFELQFIYTGRSSIHSLVHQSEHYFCQKSEGVEASTLPAHPPRSKRFCSSKGIVTPPTQTTILSRAQETVR